MVFFIRACSPYGVDGSTLIASGEFLSDWDVAMANACRRWGGVVDVCPLLTNMLFISIISSGLIPAEEVLP